MPASAIWRALTSGAPFVVPQIADAGASPTRNVVNARRADAC